MLGGTRLSPLRIGGLLVADAICFDVAYDDGLYAQVREGAQLVTVQTSNAIYIHTVQVDQQFAITRTRALELGRAIAVASPNGRSALIGPDGGVVQQAPKRVPMVLESALPLSQDLPPAVRVGEWVGRLSIPLAGASVLAALLSYRRRRNRNSGDSPPVGQVAPSPTATEVPA